MALIAETVRSRLVESESAVSLVKQRKQIHAARVAQADLRRVWLSPYPPATSINAGALRRHHRAIVKPKIRAAERAAHQMTETVLRERYPKTFPA